MAAKNLSAPLIGGSAASTGAADPFYTIRDVLDGEVRALRVKFESWKSLLDSCNTATDLSFKMAHDDFAKELSRTDDRCAKLKQAVQNIEKNRGKFSHIDDKELASRREMVWALEKSVVSMKEVFLGRETKGKMDADAKRELQSKAVSETAALSAASNPYAMANSDYMKGQQQQMTQLRREQDQHLEALSGSLARVGEMAKAIGDEVREQDKLMDDIGEDMDRTQGKMDQAIKHIEKLLQTKDRCTLISIALLVLVFIITAIVAFYMLGR